MLSLKPLRDNLIFYKIMKLRIWNISNLGMSNWSERFVLSPVVHSYQVCILGLLPAALHVSVGDCINSEGRISSAGSVWLSLNKLLFHLTLLSKKNPKKSVQVSCFYGCSIFCLNVTVWKSAHSGLWLVMQSASINCVFSCTFRSLSKCPFEVLPFCWGVHFEEL